MKVKLLLPAAIIILSTARTLAQSADEEAIKQTLRTETESYYNRDMNAWKNTYVQNEKTTVTYVNPNGYTHNTGWDNFGVPLLQWVAQNPQPEKYNELRDDNYIIRLFGNAATVEYDEMMIFPEGDPDHPYISHEFRTLEKTGDGWKIVSLTSVDTSFQSPTLAGVENKINAAGYGLMQMKKTKDAIEVLKMNVKMFPKSWNVYQSLGEAYLRLGNKEEAIKNYQTAVKLNPNNEGGKNILARLMKGM